MYTKLKPFFLITAITFFYLLPIIANPNIFLNRGNDLEEFFWPIYHFSKQQITENKALPLWNNLFLSGTPLLPDPQAPIFYLPNIIFLILPVGAGFIVSLFFHTLIGALGMFILGRRVFKLSLKASLLSSILYISIPRFASSLEAGHFGLIASFAWLPYLTISLFELAKSQKIIWVVAFSIFLSALFFTHTPTFVIAALSSGAIFGTLVIFFKKKGLWLKSFLLFLVSALLTFGLTAISMLPQIEWAPKTTRYLLLERPDTYPKWNSKLEFFQVLTSPLLIKIEGFRKLDTEKIITLGIFPIILSIWGIIKLKKRAKLLIFVFLIPFILIALNNSSPIYSFLLSTRLFLLNRVATRIWFVVVIATSILAGLAYDFLSKKIKAIAFLIAMLAIVESLTYSWIFISKPVIKRENIAPIGVYEYLKDTESRVFCTNRCLSQKKAAIYNLETIEGYSTLIQTNYYKQAWQLTGSFWDYYTLVIPPIGVYKYEKLQPDAKSLGEYNVKYIVSPHKLESSDFVLEKIIDSYFVYKNSLLLPRARFLDKNKAEITVFTPNHVQVATEDKKSRQLILANTYSPGWKAYLNGTREVAVQEMPDALTSVDMTTDTNFVDFRYQPDSYRTGKLITLVTIALIAILYFYSFSRKLL